MKKILLYWHTLRCLAPGQIWRRVYYATCRRLRLYRTPVATGTPCFDRARLRALRAFLGICRANGLDEAADLEALRRHSFDFLHHRVENRGLIPWSDADLPRLWRYQLHAFGHARGFAINAGAAGHLGDRERALQWMRDWTAVNPVGADVAWDAYPVSERLLNWAFLAASFEISEADVAASYARQALWLERWIEYDLRGNHLLKNAVALSVAAALLNSDAARRRALGLLERQLSEQLLDDGGHCERSPMYHACALWDLLAACAALDAPPPWLEEAAARMTCFLEEILHPDGDLPLFGDAVLDGAPKPVALIRLARDFLPERAFQGKLRCRSGIGDALAPSGFFMAGDPERACRMLVKTAPPAPDWQPGHSHADMGSYELYLGKDKIIVDSGVHGYAESPWRAYCRSGRAHNIAQPEGTEQCELWGVFRVARRSKALPPLFETLEDGVQLICGYMHYSGYRHQRRIRYEKRGVFWEVRDDFENLPPGTNLFNYIHLHPDCAATLRDGCVEVCCREAVLIIEPLLEEHLEMYDGQDESSPFRYCPEFGLSLPSPTILLRQPASVGATAYRIQATL